MANISKNSLKAAAQELIEVLGLIDENKKPIKIAKNIEEEELVTLIKEAMEEITPADKFSDETKEVIDALTEKKATKKEEKKPAKKGAKVVEPDEEEDEDDEEEDDDEDPEEEDDDDEEEEKPVKKGKTPTKPIKKEEKKPAKKAPVVEDEEEDEDDEEEEEKPVKKSSKKPEKTVSEDAKERGNKLLAAKNAEKTKLGHVVGSQAGKIDEVLLKSPGKILKLKDIAEKCDVTVSRVQLHLKHLVDKKGVSLEMKDGTVVYKK